jgi:Flp pilus assembly CpaF family ATPase
VEVLFTKLIEKVEGETIQELYLNHEGVLSCLLAGGERADLGIFCSANDVVELAWKLAWGAGLRLDPFSPFAGGVIKGCSVRWHAAIPPAAPDGALIVLRKQSFSAECLKSFKFENFSESDILQWQKNGTSVVFFGPTGCGKTTLLFSLLQRYFMDCRVGIVESVVELPLASAAWFRLVQVGQDVAGKGGVAYDWLVAEMLRLSPQMIVLGEIRVAEAYVWSELSRSGHGGILTTFHAGSTAEARGRLFSNAGISGAEIPPIIGVQVRRDELGSYQCRCEALKP